MNLYKTFRSHVRLLLAPRGNSSSRYRESALTRQKLIFNIIHTLVVTFYSYVYSVWFRWTSRIESYQVLWNVYFSERKNNLYLGSFRHRKFNLSTTLRKVAAMRNPWKFISSQMDDLLNVGIFKKFFLNFTLSNFLSSGFLQTNQGEEIQSRWKWVFNEKLIFGWSVTKAIRSTMAYLKYTALYAA